jgi:hypothetical protein
MTGKMSESEKEGGHKIRIAGKNTFFSKWDSSSLKMHMALLFITLFKGKNAWAPLLVINQTLISLLDSGD